MARMSVIRYRGSDIFFSLSYSYQHHTALGVVHGACCACNNVFRLVAASLFKIFTSTCSMSNFKLTVSKNKNK